MLIFIYFLYDKSNVIFIQKGRNLMNYNENWDMESVFSGGSESSTYKERLLEVRDSITDFSNELDNWEPGENSNDFSPLKNLLQQYKSISNALGEMGSFTTGLVSADINDQKALQNSNQVADLRKYFSSENIILNKKI